MREAAKVIIAKHVTTLRCAGDENNGYEFGKEPVLESLRLVIEKSLLAYAPLEDAESEVRITERTIEYCSLEEDWEGARCGSSTRHRW